MDEKLNKELLELFTALRCKLPSLRFMQMFHYIDGMNDPDHFYTTDEEMVKVLKEELKLIKTMEG